MKYIVDNFFEKIKFNQIHANEVVESYSLFTRVAFEERVLEK